MNLVISFVTVQLIENNNVCAQFVCGVFCFGIYFVMVYVFLSVCSLHDCMMSIV